MFNYLYKSKLITLIIPTLPMLLERELKGSTKVLDLGCGPSSPISKIKHSAITTGVDAFLPYIEQAKSNKTHTNYVFGNILEMKFKKNSFDTVILIDVIEHMNEKDAYKLIDLASFWAAKKIIINTPNGFVKQHALDGNPLQEHLSGWPNKKMISMGFKTSGLAGFKFLRREVDHDSMSGSMINSIRFRPKVFWFMIAIISQSLTYFIPSLAFSLFCVKRIKD